MKYKNIAKRYKSFNFFTFPCPSGRRGFSLDSGFTIIEIIVSVSIIVILAGVGLISFRNSRDVKLMVSTAGNIMDTSRLAQSKTLAGEGDSQWGVRLEQSRFILFKGADFAFSPDTKIYDLPSTVEIVNINLTGGGQEIVFNRLTGATDKFGSFDARVKNSPSSVFSVTIDSSGKLSQTQAPAAPTGTRIADTRHRDFNLGWSIKTGNNLILTFYNPPNPNTVVSVPMAGYFSSDMSSFDWSESTVIEGQTQTLRIHTTFLSDTNTTLSVDRDCRYNNKQMKISVDTKEIVTYSADCQSLTIGTYGGTVTEP